MSEERFLVDLAIRLHEVGADASRESILAQLDEVIRRWHEAEEKARDYDNLNGRLILAESQGWQDRHRVDELQARLSKLEARTNQLEGQQWNPAPYATHQTVYTPGVPQGGPR